MRDLECPPLSAGGAELCTDFDMVNLGYPGPFCVSALGEPINEASDLGACVATLVGDTGERFVDALYGGPSGPPTLSPLGAQCLAVMGVAARTVVTATFKNASQCRATVARGKLIANPKTCLDDSPKLRARVSKAVAKARSMVVGTCSVAVLDELPACGNAAGITTVDDAADCVVDFATAAVDPRTVPAERTFAAPSFLEGVFPPAPVCGDGVRNQVPCAFLPLGEECDGDDDDDCPGQCIPPGDAFECTCGDVPRMRVFTDSTSSENDSGWTGLGHDQTLGHLSGFVASLSNCDCAAMEDGQCVGMSTDPICDVYGDLSPRCSWSVDGSAWCSEDMDCYVCDANSINAGAQCNNDGNCASQCFDAGVPTGPCSAQTDCGAGQVCRGRCDTSQTCIAIPNGSPHPVSVAGFAVCTVQRFRTDLVGTRNIFNGAHELYYRQYSRIHQGESVDRPCPVCGGFCHGGPNDLSVCKGRCSSSQKPCRFQSDCGSAETCSETSPDCPNGKCELALVCGSVNPQVNGKPCRIDYEDPVYGTPSSDCAPASSSNISGEGLELDYWPATSGTRTMSSTVPCSGSGWELYDCPCPDDGGLPTAPNTCFPACNAIGSNFGSGCADGDSTGAGTVCDGGDNDGRLCDEDSDCPDGGCSRNPTHCVGDPAFEHKACATSAECGLGLCLDACPAGRCVPLCVPVTGDPTEGECAAGPIEYHCENQQQRPCPQGAPTAGCTATCAINGGNCSGDDDCQAGDHCAGACLRAEDCEAGDDAVLGTGDDIKGAGECTSSPRDCFLDPIVATGSAVDASNHDSVAIWCLGANSDVINFGSGFGGPARVEIRGLNVTNFSSIAP